MKKNTINISIYKFESYRKMKSEICLLSLMLHSSQTKLKNTRNLNVTKKGLLFIAAPTVCITVPSGC